MNSPDGLDEPEYTLSGVLRFLQTEWRRNERDKMQWDIERTEMKNRIRRLESANRSLQLSVDSYKKILAAFDARLVKEGDTALTSEVAALMPALSVLNEDDKDQSQKLEEIKSQFDACITGIREMLEDSGIYTNQAPVSDRAVGPIISTAKSRLRKTLANLGGSVKSAAMISETTAVFGMDDGRILAWDLVDDNALGPQGQYKLEQPVTFLTASVSTQEVYASNAGSVIVLKWDRAFAETLRIPNIAKSLVAMAYSDEYRLLACALATGECNLLSMSNGQLAGAIKSTSDIPSVRPTTIAFCHGTTATTLQNLQLIIGCNNSSISIADVTTGELVRRLYNPPEDIMLSAMRVFPTAFLLVRVSQKVTLLLVGNASGDIRLCDLHTGTIKDDVMGAHAGAVTSFCCAPEPEEHNYTPITILSSGTDGQTSIWSLTDSSITWKGRLFMHDSSEGGGINCAVWSPTKNRVAVCGGDALVRVYNMTDC